MDTYSAVIGCVAAVLTYIFGEHWIMIAVAFGASAVFVEIGKTLGIDLGMTTLLGFFVLASLLVNEIRSICENLVEMGIHIPKILIRGLEVANRAINKDDAEKEDEEEEENK